MKVDTSLMVAVVGGGTMGTGIAQVAATAGHRVLVIDSADEALARGRASLSKSLRSLAARGRLSAADADAIEGRVGWSTSLDAAAGAGLIVEAVIERLDVKRALFTALGAASPEALLASNTSSLSISAIADGVPGPERVLGLHFFNPVPAMKLVEVVAGERTARGATAAATQLMLSWGKRPVAVADVPGFIVNRVARPYYAEAFAALAEGIAPEAIDLALVSSGGFRMGPLALADMIGHDVNYAVATSVFESYCGATRFRPQPAQQALVEAKRLGRKSGAGVFEYPGETPQAAIAPAGPVPSKVRVSAAGGTSAPLFREAGMAVFEDAALPFGIVWVDGVRLAMTDGRPLAARDDVEVLADVARDFAVANTIVLTARDDRSGAVMAGFVQATGRRALILPDRPGMIVLRTLAQLANAAADAVADEVATVSGIDEAMVYGANHPEGPLHWAERATPRRVAAALDNIADATGDAMYRPATLLARA